MIGVFVTFIRVVYGMIYMSVPTGNITIILQCVETLGKMMKHEKKFSFVM